MNIFAVVVVVGAASTNQFALGPAGRGGWGRLASHCKYAIARKRTDFSSSRRAKISSAGGWTGERVLKLHNIFVQLDTAQNQQSQAFS